MRRVLNSKEENDAIPLCFQEKLGFQEDQNEAGVKGDFSAGSRR